MSIYYKLRWTDGGRHTRHIAADGLSERVSERAIAHWIGLSEINQTISIQNL